jgi:TRAP transporter 4TM/12TM fusion protein
MRGVLPAAVGGLAAGLSLFELWAVLVTTLDPYLHRLLFLGLALGLTFLAEAARADRAGPAAASIAWAAAVLGATASLAWQSAWIRFRWPLVDRLGPVEIAAGLVLIAAVVEVTRRTLGRVLVVLIALLLAYGLAGHLLPGLLYHRPLAIWELVDQLVFTSNGLFGAPVAVAATYVYFFVLFGTALEQAGATTLFFRLARRVAGRTRGGAAKIAIVASALYGTVTGSPTSNVVTTGTLTIPLMRRSGLTAHLAAAVEAIASTGGSLMPPVMGSAAFLMAEYTGIPYGDIVVAAILPALLFYWSVFLQVHLRAARTHMTPLGEVDDGAPAASGLDWLHLAPLATLVVLLVGGYSPLRAAAVALALTVALTWLQPGRRLGIGALARILVLAAERSLLVAGACAAAGLVIGVAAGTGLAGKLAGLIFQVSGGSVLLALLLTMGICILLGMGMPTPSAYVITAVLASPPLAILGLPTLSTHLFIVYFAVLSAVTPPVAVAAYAAAAVAGASPTRVAWESVRLGLVAFIVPFFFVYQPALLLRGDLLFVGLAVPTATLGVSLLAAALEGWLRGPLAPVERLAAFVGGLCLVFPGWRTDALGVALGLFALRRQRRQPALSSPK